MLVEGGIEFETRRVLQNLGEVLAAAGVDFIDVIRTTIFMVGPSSYLRGFPNSFIHRSVEFSTELVDQNLHPGIHIL